LFRLPHTLGPFIPFFSDFGLYMAIVWRVVFTVFFYGLRLPPPQQRPGSGPPLTIFFFPFVFFLRVSTLHDPCGRPGLPPVRLLPLPSNVLENPFPQSPYESPTSENRTSVPAGMILFSDDPLRLELSPARSIFQFFFKISPLVRKFQIFCLSPLLPFFHTCPLFPFFPSAFNPLENSLVLFFDFPPFPPLGKRKFGPQPPRGSPSRTSGDPSPPSRDMF